MRWFCSPILVILAILGLVLPAEAQPSATRAITPVPYNDGASVAVSVSLDQKEPRIGSTVAICFLASRAGYATLWNISTRGDVTRIFPNSFQPGVTASHVDADRRYCAGVSGDPFRFRVDGPPGTEDLYLIWTARPELQPQAATYPDAASLVAGMQKIGGANAADWVSAKHTYDIVPATGAVPPPLPPQQVTGATAPPETPVADRPKVFVLAMGANVDKLTKTNQDASVFTEVVTGLFGVRPEQTRLLVNATYADFFKGIQWLADHARPQDFVFIYFSGHGGQFANKTSDDGKDEFLVPYDFNTPGADPNNLILSQEFAGWINGLRTKNVVAVIDACHSAGVFRSMEAETLGARKKFMAFPASDDPALSGAASRPRTRAAGGRNRIRANGILLAAAHRDQSALEGANGGFFTLALTREMRSKAGGTLADVFARTVDYTLQLTHNRQTPEAVGDLETAHHIQFNP